MINRYLKIWEEYKWRWRWALRTQHYKSSRVDSCRIVLRGIIAIDFHGSLYTFFLVYCYFCPEYFQTTLNFALRLLYDTLILISFLQIFVLKVKLNFRHNLARSNLMELVGKHPGKCHPSFFHQKTCIMGLFFKLELTGSW
jgi:hypothetical protein